LRRPARPMPSLTRCQATEESIDIDDDVVSVVTRLDGELLTETEVHPL